MNKLLINKYQPTTLDEFNNGNNNEITQFINKLIYTNELKIIILGNIGTGKTTLINNILHKYYDIDNITKVNNNILYINNLKEQGISFYKNDVKNFCKSLSEINNKRKTIVLDDIDLLSDQNQQIFKIHMDNYIDSVNFICSCNNLNKVNIGILSHLINIKLKNTDNIQLTKILENICHKENLNLNEIFKNNILMYSNNSIKSLINNLEKYKISHTNESGLNKIMINNNLLNDRLNNYFDICFTKKLHNAYNKLYLIFNDGYSIIDIIDYMYTYLKNDITIDSTKKYLIIQILSKYIININNNYEDVIILYFLTLDIVNII